MDSSLFIDRLTEDFGYYIEYHPKPIKGDWNGLGMHANFSNSILRECGSQDVYENMRGISSSC